MKGLITKLSIKVKTVSCEGIEFEMEGFSGWEKHAHVIEVVQFQSLWKLEVIVQPLVIFKVRKSSYYLAPVWNTFPALGGVSND